MSNSFLAGTKNVDISTDNDKKSMRINGLDTIRFICAVIVLLGHSGLPLPEALTNEKNHLLYIVGAMLNLLFNGPAAVIVFFVLSGLVIHLPFSKNASKFNIKRFYTRRLVRICIPAIAAVVLYLAFQRKLTPPDFGVFWSVICETIYYLIYPLLLLLFKRIKIINLVAVTYCATLVLLVLNKQALLDSSFSYTALGYNTWFVGLPIWLSGCWLAENYQKFPLLSSVKMNVVRLFIFGVSYGLRLAKFHISAIWASNCFSLNAFGLLVCLWLGMEIRYNSVNKSSSLLEKAGKWSYSLYLAHELAKPVFLLFFPGNKHILHYINFPLALCISYAFYMLIERPSHKLAINLSSKF